MQSQYTAQTLWAARPRCYSVAPMNHTHFRAAFQDGARFLGEDGAPITVRLIGAPRLPDLLVKSGGITAGDPFTMDFADARPFNRPVPPGRYPVELAVACFDNGDQRVAAARVRLLPGAVARHELAYFDGDDPKDYGPDDVPVYGVDAGTGCFTDPAWAQDDPAEDFDPEDLSEILNRTYQHTLSYGAIPLGACNLVAFSSGWGDGAYSSYWGLSASGAALELVTDFRLLVRSQTQAVRLPLPLKRGPLLHPVLTALQLSAQALGPHRVELTGVCDVEATAHGPKGPLGPVSSDAKGARRVLSLEPAPPPGAELRLTFFTGVEALEPLG